MLSYIEPLPRKTSHVVNTFEWTLSQIEELQLHTLAALSILLPSSLNEYFEYHTGTRLLLFYEWTINDGKKRLFSWKKTSCEVIFLLRCVQKSRKWFFWKRWPR